MDEYSSLGTISKLKGYFWNARARNTHFDAKLNHPFPAQVELDAAKMDDDRVLALCDDTGVPPIELLPKIVKTLLSERKSAADVVEELAQLESDVVELCGLAEIGAGKGAIQRRFNVDFFEAIPERHA